MTTELYNPLVSIIVASYNHVEYLEQRMDSLLHQSYENIEIIVIDDKSTDGSFDFLQRYSSHSKVQLVRREENGGWVKVSNQGASLARGAYILFANCDDSCDTKMIESLVRGIQASPTAGISFCRSLLIDEYGQLIGNDFDGRESRFKIQCCGDTLISKASMGRFLLDSCVIPNLSAALIQKSYFTSVGGFDGTYRVCSDWHLFFRLAELGEVAYIAQPLNNFRQHATTIRSETKERVIYDEIIRLLLGEMKRIDLSTAEIFKFKLHVMYLWAHHLLRPSMAGLINFPHHLSIVFKLDPLAILLLPLAATVRIIQLPLVLARKISQTRNINVV